MSSNRDNLETRLQSTNWGVLPRVLLIAVLLLPALSLAPRADAAPKVQPDLLAIAAQHPDARVSVIVQKVVKDNSVENMVTQLGGTVTKDLHIINAFAATLPAKGVSQLARANGVRWVSMDAPVVKTDCSNCPVDTTKLLNAYDRAIGADRVWNLSTGYRQGQGVGVAIVDSGVDWNNDFQTTSGGWRILANAKFSSFTASTQDKYGHGTHVAGIVAGNGSYSSGGYVGVAPRANLLNLKVSDDQGQGTASSVVDALQWVLNNKATYNIRVVNISLNSSVGQSYNVDPIDAACEILWFNGVVVVVAAGNSGTTGLYAPANDPFVITVGATDDKGTAALSDDTIASFSAYGTTSDGIAKPDLVAPGTNIISVRTGASNATLPTLHPANKVGQYYFKMSGTSMAAPMVAGAVALLLQDEPNLNPDQVKYRLKSTAVSSTTTWRGYNAPKAGAGYLNVYGALMGTSTASSNTNLPASRLLWSGSTPVTWNSVNWNSVNWNSVNWNSVNWNSVNWNSVNWNSDYWGQ